MDRCVLEQINNVNKQRDGQRMKDSQSYQSSVTGEALHTFKKLGFQLIIMDNFVYERLCNFLNPSVRSHCILCWTWTKQNKPILGKDSASPQCPLKHSQVCITLLREFAQAKEYFHRIRYLC